MRPITTRYLLQAALTAGLIFSTARAGVQDAPANGAAPAFQAPPPTAADQVWLVNTRSLPHTPMRASRQSSRRRLPEVERHDNGWHAAHYDDLAGQEGPATVTVVFVHGNDTEDFKCRARGLALYQALAAEAPASLRLIVWSWPADHVPGSVRHDARLKAERAEADAVYLARFLADLKCGRQVVVVGYSLGARVTGGALHLLAGGALRGDAAGRLVADQHPPLRGVLMAAAIDDDWLLPGRRYGRALSAVERMTLFVNAHDRVLRWYRFLTPSSGPALGVRGVAALDELGPQRPKLEQVDVNPFLGGQHGWSNYSASAQVIELLKHEVFGRGSPLSLTARRNRLSPPVEGGFERVD